MRKKLCLLLVSMCLIFQMHAQLEPDAANWRTWFIGSGKDYRLSTPSSNKDEVAQVIWQQQNLDSAGWQQILYWGAGAPGYRWHTMMTGLWTVDTGNYGALANMLLGVAIYDATIAAWDTKYAYKRPRPYAADNRIKAFLPKPESPSYPCEYSVAAGVAVTIFSHFYPALADSVTHMAHQLMQSRIAAGWRFLPIPVQVLNSVKKIAEKEIEHTKDYAVKTPWDGKMPEGTGVWRGKFQCFHLPG